MNIDRIARIIIDALATADYNDLIHRDITSDAVAHLLSLGFHAGDRARYLNALVPVVSALISERHAPYRMGEPIEYRDNRGEWGPGKFVTYTPQGFVRLHVETGDVPQQFEVDYLRVRRRVPVPRKRPAHV